MNYHKTKTEKHDFLNLQDLFLDTKLSSEITSPYWQECYQAPADTNLLFQGKNRYWLNYNSRGRDYFLAALSARKSLTKHFRNRKTN